MSQSAPAIIVLEDTRTVLNYIRDVLRPFDATHPVLLARKIAEAITNLDLQLMHIRGAFVVPLLAGGDHSMTHRVNDVVDSETDGSRAIPERHVASVEILPEITDIVVVIRD